MFVPEWKNLKSWIYQRCWEDELPETNKTDKTENNRLQELIDANS